MKMLSTTSIVSSYSDASDWLNDTSTAANRTMDDQTTLTPQKSLSLLEQLQETPEYSAAVIINNNYLYVLCALGLPGNICALITISRMKPLTSSSIYIAMISLIDAFNLIFKLSYLLLTLYDIRLYDGGCKTMYFMGTFFMHYSNWLLVSMTIERFVAIWFPLKVTKLCTKRRACINIVLLAVILTGVNLQFFWSTNEVPHSVYAWKCSFVDSFVYFISKIWYWIDGAAYSIVPCILLIFFNTMIILGIKMASSKQKLLTNKIDKTQGTEKVKYQQQITRMLVSVSVVFVILTMPNCIFFILEGYWDYTKTIHSYAQYFLVMQVIFFLSDANHAINFYLYFLSGRKFRMMFINMICCCRKKPLRRPYSTTMTQMSSMRSGSTYTSRMDSSSQQGILKNSPNGSANNTQTNINTNGSAYNSQNTINMNGSAYNSQSTINTISQNSPNSSAYNSQSTINTISQNSPNGSACNSQSTINTIS